MTQIFRNILGAVLLAGAATCAAADPAYRVDPNWPAPMPNQWLLGDVSGVSVDKHDHIWIIQRPGTVAKFDLGAASQPPTAKCCVTAPPVIEFDTTGRVLRAWGGAKSSPDWFDNEHSIFVDTNDYVWLLGAGEHDGQVLKFTMDGKQLLRIGGKGEFRAADDPTMLGRPADLYVDTDHREVFVADGYRNRRVIVFDSESGAFKRQWSAYGRTVDPRGVNGGPEFGGTAPANKLDLLSTVHCVTMIGDEIYVCDRSNNRIQVFTRKGKFLRDLFFNRELGGRGSTWDATPVPGKPDLIAVIDGSNSEIGLLDRQTGRVVASYLAKGHLDGQMHWPHQLAADREGRLYIGEVDKAGRIQRFVPTAR